MENQLAVIIKESQLEHTKAQYILENFQDYFKIASEWEVKASTIQVTNVEQKTEMKMAREARLFLRDKRLDVEKARKRLKEQSLREGKAIDGIANVLKALIEPIEQYLDKQEHFVELQQTEEEARLKVEAEARAEAERIAKEKAEESERERIRLENETLKKEAEAREKAIELERQAVEKQRLAQEEKSRQEREAQEKIMQAEREKAEAKQRELEEKAKAEAEAREKLEEEKRENERQEAEQKRLELEAKKEAAQAPDKEKLNHYAVELGTIEVPKLSTKESREILEQALAHLKKAIELLKA